LFLVHAEGCGACLSLHGTVKKKDQLMLQTCWLHAIQPFETPINLLVEYLATLGSGAASTLGSGAGEKKTDRD
jgi:hypothetical protein